MFSQQRPTLNRESIKKEQYKRNKAKQAKAQKGNVQKKVAEVGRTYTQSKKNAVKKRSESAHYDNSQNTALTVSTTSVSATSEATSRYITVYGNSDWYIDGNYSNWIHASKSDDNLYVYIDANNSTQSRSDYFSISNGYKSVNISISQTGKPAYINVSASDVSFSSDGGTRTIHVDANCDWNINVPIASWGSLSTTGNSITIKIKPNNSSSQRTDYFTIKGGGIQKRVNITQTASYSSYNNSNSYYSNNSSNTFYKSSYTRHKSSGPFLSFGIDGDIETNLGSESGTQTYFSVGLLTRLGQPKHTLNFITGLRFRWFRVMPSYGNSDSEYKYFGRLVGIPADFRINIVHIGDNGAVYIGAGAEFGVYIADEEYENSMEENYYSFSPLLGYANRHFDISAYWKRYQSGPFVNDISRYNTEFDSSSMIGLKIGFYF